MSEKPNIWQRRRARRALVQAIYEWQLSNNSYQDILQSFQEGDALKKADNEFFATILRTVINDAEELDRAYADLLDRPVARLDHVEHAVLRLATAEFRDRIDVPYRVVIDEYVELTKVFGAQDAYKYINGVLDRLAHNLRSIETTAR
jgi:N utilization substance protein B